MGPKKPDLTPAEWAIMRVVWERKEVVVRDVYEALKERENWAQTTVRTMMERLARKGYLRQKRVGPVYLYTAVVGRKPTVRRMVRDLLERLTPEGAMDLVAYAVEDADLSDSELAALEGLIRARKGRGEAC